MNRNQSTQHKYLLASIFMFLALMAACQPKEQHTLVLGHRANGAKHAHPNEQYAENSLSAIKQGLKIFDGIEIDIQASADGTLWIYHDPYLPGTESCIPKSSDSEIEAINKELKEYEQMQKLSSIMPIFAKNKSKTISIDVKVYHQQSCVSGKLMPLNYYLNIADSLSLLISKHDLSNNIIIEAPHFKLLQQIEEQLPVVKTFYLSFGKLDPFKEILLEKHVDGVSIGYKNGAITKNKIDSLHTAGKFIQVWTVNEVDKFKALMDMQPDYIQTDNKDLMENR